MPTDHPDGTLPIAFAAADIKVPIDIQAQFVTLDVDITAQTVGNISIDIAAQTVGNIAINLAASDITLDINLKTSAITLNVNISSQTANIDVDIKAQTIGNLTIDIEAQSVGVYIQAEWAAKEGDSKQLVGSGDIAATSLLILIDYTVPAGKTFFVTHWAVSTHAFSSALVGLDVGARFYNFTDSATEAFISGNFGAWGVFSVPLVIDASHRIQITVYNTHTALAAFEATLGGYLV